MLTNIIAGGIRCVEIFCIENKAGNPQPPKANGVSEAEPRRCGDFTAFFQKNTHMFGIVCSIAPLPPVAAPMINNKFCYITLIGLGYITITESSTFLTFFDTR